MKLRRKFLFLCVFIFLLTFFLSFGAVIVKAEGESGYQEELSSTIREQLEILDLEALENYLQSLGRDFDYDVRDRLLAFIKGEALDYESFFQGILDVFGANVKKLIPSFACMAAIAILCGVLNSLQTNFMGESTAKIVFFVAYLGALIPLLNIVSSCIFVSKNIVSSLGKQMEIIFPIMLTLMAASGGSVSAAIYRPSVAFLSNSMVTLIERIVFPLTIAIIVFSIASKLFGELKTEKFSTFFKSINKWIIGLSVSVFGLFFTLQGITAASYDGIARRAAKYAIGTGIPIIGGFLSGGFDLTIAGSILIKNSLGYFSLFLICAVLFEPLTLLTAAILMLRLTAAITQPFGESKISGILEETASNLNYFVAGVLFAAFLYFMVILLMVCASEALI